MEARSVLTPSFGVDVESIDVGWQHSKEVIIRCLSLVHCFFTKIVCVVIEYVLIRVDPAKHCVVHHESLLRLELIC